MSHAAIATIRWAMLVLYIALMVALGLAVAPPEPCFTDSCVGCTDDCLDTGIIVPKKKEVMV